MNILLRFSAFLIFICTYTSSFAQTQTWKPSMDGILDGGIHQRFVLHIEFKPGGPLGRDWIYGMWLDSDSVVRYVGYREGGKWVPLPITGSFNEGRAYDIVQYGDTMYIGGVFTQAVLDGDSTGLPWVGIIKYWNDSLWFSDIPILYLQDFAVSGDSLLMWVYDFPTPTGGGIAEQALTPDGGATWQYPYSIPHPNPNGPWSGFGYFAKLEFRNGDIYTLNDGAEGPFKGVARWDGQQWHSHGDGIYGTYSKATDFEFYMGDLYMSGSFHKGESPLNPGRYIARWDGTKWNEVGGGVHGVWAGGLFQYNNLLYAHSPNSNYGDAHIPLLAAWDGHQWCGTPINYGGDPPTNFGVINDTLYSVCHFLPATANGQLMSYMNYFDGDYVNGPNSVCSTLGLGEEEIAAENILEIYPNPARGSFIISLRGEAPKGSYSLYSLKGQRLLSGEINSSESKIILPAGFRGMYVVEVRWKGNVARKKLVVE